MDLLLENMEELVDEVETPGYEVEYHVRDLFHQPFVNLTDWNTFLFYRVESSHST